MFDESRRHGASVAPGFNDSSVVSNLSGFECFERGFERHAVVGRAASEDVDDAVANAAIPSEMGQSNVEKALVIAAGESLARGRRSDAGALLIDWRDKQCNACTIQTFCSTINSS